MDGGPESASFNGNRGDATDADGLTKLLTVAIHISDAICGVIADGKSQVLVSSSADLEETMAMLGSAIEARGRVLSFALPSRSANDTTLYLQFADELPDAARLDSLRFFLDTLSGPPAAGDRGLASIERDLRVQLDMIPALAWIATPDGGLESANKQWHDYTGLDHGAAVGAGFMAAFHPDDLERVIQVWSEIRIAGKPGGVEARMLRHDGEARYFVLRAVPRFGETGEIVKWYGINTDIHELKRAEFELLKSRTVMEEAQRIIATGSWSWDMTTDTFTCSEQCARIVGLNDQNITFQMLSERIHPDDREMVAEAHGRALQGEELDVKHRFVLDDGEVKYIHARGRLILDESNKPRAYIGTIVDVTEAKLSEDRIKSSLAQAERAQASLAEAQRLSHVGSFQIRPSTNEIVWSAETYNIFDLDPDIPLTVERIIERIHPDDRERVQKVYDEGVRTRGPWEVEHRLLMPDGSVRHVHCVTRVETDPEREPEVFGAIIDQTERINFEEALRKAQADIMRLNRLTAMGAVTVSIAHEMNQPLMAIVTNAATCLTWLSRPDPDIAEAKVAAERIIQEGKRAGDVLLNVRGLARNARPSLDLVDVNEVVKSVLTMLRSELRGREIHVETSFADGLSRVKGDKVQLQQVFLNLLLNAAEAVMDTGHLRRICVSSGDRGVSSVAITIEDNGSGIDPIAAERIFEAFFSTKAEGTGMGLAICRSIVQAHSGSLTARPIEAGGSLFEVVLPCVGG